MSLDQQYRTGIILARNAWIVRNTNDADLKARVCRDSAKLRRQLREA